MTIKIQKSNVISAKTFAAFAEYAKNEWKTLWPQRRWVYLMTKRYWTLFVNGEPVCVIGLKKNSLIGTGAELYFMLCKKFSAHVKQLVRFLRRGIRRLARLYRKVIVTVESEYWIGRKFVEFLGFRHANTVNNHAVYEMRASWLQ